MTIVVIGARAQRLCRLIQHSNKNRLDVAYSSFDAADFDAVLKRGHAILCSADAFNSTGLSDLVDTIKRLRRRSLFWGSVYVLLPDVLAFQDSELHRKLVVEGWGVHLHDEEWKIYCDLLPPRDVVRLFDDIAASEPLQPVRRRRICLDLLHELLDGIAALIEQFSTELAATPFEVRECLGEVHQQLQKAAKGGPFAALDHEISRLIGLPDVLQSDRTTLLQLLRAAEKEVFDGSQDLYAALHRLKNELLLPDGKRVHEPSSLRELAHKLLTSEANHFDGLARLCQRVIDELEALYATGSAGSVNRFIEILADLSAWLVQNDHPINATERGSSRRILIVEDHPKWQARVLHVVRSLGLNAEVADDISTARDALRHGEPALVIVDLGLPFRKSELPVPRAGLTLVREFSGTAQGVSFQHRFVLLTAAEDYAQAVHEAVGLGLSPSSYLLKNASVCENELPAQIRLALQPVPAGLPRIEVFLRTGRIARVEDVEVTLDRPVWCLLSVLAGCPRRFLSRDRIAEVLAREPYHLDPKSRDPALRTADPQDIISSQLPYYISELRLALDRAYRQGHHTPVPQDFVEVDDDQGYRLNARAVVWHQIEEHSTLNRRPVVLVLEDNDRWRQKIGNALELFGFSVVPARWVDEAKTILSERTVDLISLDLELPRTEEDYRSGQTDGERALEFFRYSKLIAPDIPVALLTGSAWHDRTMMPLLKAGIRLEDYIYKTTPDAINRLRGSLFRLWLEVQRNARIVGWDVSIPSHPIHIDPQEKVLTTVAGRPVRAPGDCQTVLKVLSETPNLWVSRTELIEAVYGADDDGGPTINRKKRGGKAKNAESALNNLIDRLRQAIEKQTGIPREEIICGDRGAYMLRGLPQ